MVGCGRFRKWEGVMSHIPAHSTASLNPKWRRIKNWNCFKRLRPYICPLISSWNEFLQFQLSRASTPPPISLPRPPLLRLPRPGALRGRINPINSLPPIVCCFFSADHTSRINIWLAFRRGGKYLLTLFVNLSVPPCGLCLAARNRGAGVGWSL